VFGQYKVPLAEAFAVAHDVDLAASTFYSDSYNDLPLLRRVGIPVAVNPDLRLWRHARQHGWRIEQWR
jgi:alcohol-forming fatty acyl-CoA reductase